MDKQKRFNEEVLKKVANLNSHIKKLNDILWEVSAPLPDDFDNGYLEGIGKEARSVLGEIGEVINEILDKLDDRE